MPGLIKIGYTKIALNDRLSQLNSTGVPVPFEIGASFMVKNPKKCESEIHHLLKSYRVSNEREFFNLSLKKAVHKSLKVVQKFIFESDNYSENIVNTSNLLDLSEPEISILKFLAVEGRKFGFLTWQIHDKFRDMDELDLEYFLACLKGHSFVDEKTERQHHDKNWKINSNGIKYLYETGVFTCSS